MSKVVSVVAPAAADPCRRSCGDAVRAGDAARARSAFTLIELLVVAAILALVGAAIGACIAGGIRVWDRARTFHVAESEALLGLERFSSDVMNTFHFYAIPFEGATAELSLPALVVASEGGVGEAGRVGTVRYYFDRGRGGLYRLSAVFPLSPPQRSAGAEEVVSGLSDLRLTYLDRRNGGWEDAWQNRTNRPSGVRVEMRFVDGDRSRDVTRTLVMATHDPVAEQK